MNTTQKNQPVSVRLGHGFGQKLKAAKSATGLSQADLLRLAAERGLPLVLKKFGKPAEHPGQNAAAA
jgi:hypothetical protein